MDGWTVAGGSAGHYPIYLIPWEGSKLGEKFVNASFLHNSIFTPELINSPARIAR